MELSPNKVWERKEWEGHVNDLLRIKHGQENYVPIPDRHNGDAGIEGYSFCGNAYQSFCPEELCSTAELYEKQRDKMTLILISSSKIKTAISQNSLALH